MIRRTSRNAGVWITRWIILPVLGLAGGVLIVSNVILQTKTVRGWCERKLEARSGLVWTIDSLSWTPWTGVQVGGVKAELSGPGGNGAKPLYEVEKIDVRVHWGRLLKGRVSPRDVRLRKGRIAVPIELASLLPPSRGSPKGPADTEREREDPQQKEKEPGKNGEKGKEPPTEEKETGEPAPGEKPARVTPARQAANQPFIVHLNDFEIQLYSISGGGKTRLALVGVDAELPLAGEDAEGWISARGLRGMGRETAEGFRSVVEWKRPLLLLPRTNYEWQGLSVEAACSIRPQGAPVCKAEVQIKPGALELTPIEGMPELQVSASHVEALGRFRGNLRDFQSWQGDGEVRLEGLRLAQKERGDERVFDEGRMTAVMRGGSIQVVDARLLSERLSFLGNGVALSDGRVFGVLRVVADRENAQAITRVAIGSTITGGWMYSWLRPLDTPDRLFRDINVRGTMSKATANVGRRGEELEVTQAWRRMVAFVKSEVNETKQGVAPTVPPELLLPQ